ncbi:putative chlorophyll A-B binding protein [Medicago truncatula]|uniref:Putative chlorophyll A-B binding protein n=1 Tax=Medicago truncatula TaxID=3880 RepID=A0A396GPG0_MEDTR|nr:stress enhanced protein 2, chloroplastic [Medicago truncatula]RHN42992.1 putative chlorophyll A-B binding protein [Medicago truncatula]
MASATRVTNCDLRPPKVSSSRSRPRKAVPVQFSIPEPESANTNIVLQPRLCTLRSYGSDPVGAVIKTRKEEEDMQVTDDVSSFFATLSEYIESSKKSQDFEIISGRLAMMVFAATVTVELVTGNSVFRKMDIAGITEAGGICFGAVTLAAMFAWFSSARTRVDRIFTVSYNSFIDLLIDQIIDGLFYDDSEGEL